MPDDPWYEDMNPVLKIWLYQSWQKSLEEKNDFARSYSILTGSFTNPDMAQKMIKQENPDFEASDEDYEKVSQEMLEKNKKELAHPRRMRRRKVLKE